MNKEKFKKLATDTGAIKCIYFDYSYLIKESCAKGRNYSPCSLMQNKECSCFTGGING